MFRSGRGVTLSQTNSRPIYQCVLVTDCEAEHYIICHVIRCGFRLRSPNCTPVCYKHVSLFPALLTLRHYRHEQTKRTWQPESAGRQTAVVEPLAGLEIRRCGPLFVPWAAALWCCGRRTRLKHDAFSYGTVKTRLQRRHSMNKHTVCRGVLYYQNVTQCHGTKVHIMLGL